MIAAIAMSMAVSHMEDQRRASEFRRRCEHFTLALQSSIDDYVDTLYATRSLFEAETHVDPGLFHRFVEPLFAKRPAIRAIEWVPLVTGADRRDFEDSARHRDPKFSIREIGAGGALVAAAERAEYHPIVWVEPIAGNELAVGLDISTDAVRGAALRRAKDSALATAAGPLAIVQAADDETGYLVLVPVYTGGARSGEHGAGRARYQGVVVGVFQLNTVLSETRTRIPAAEGIMIVFRDQEGVVDVDVDAGHVAPLPGRGPMFLPPFGFDAKIEVADRRLALSARPTPEYLRENSSRLFLVTVAGAGILTITMLLYLLLIRRQFAEQEALSLALGESEARYRGIVENAPEGLFVFDADRNRFVDANSKGLALVKATYENMLGSSVTDFSPRIQPDGRDSAAQIRDVVQRVLAGATVTFPWVYRDTEGKESTCEVRVTRLPSPGRNLIAASVADTSDRRRSEQRQLLMARELDHRVKNNLATVLSIAEQTGASSSSFAEFQSAFSRRVRAMARVHETMAAGHWEGADVHTIAQQMLEPFIGAGERLRIEGPPVVLTSAAASSLSLVFHELGDNAAKYGALASDVGSVSITWRMAPDSTLHLEWNEKCGTGVVGEYVPGFGMRLMSGLIAHELGGDVSFSYGESGMVCAMSLPAEHLLAPEGHS